MKLIKVIYSIKNVYNYKGNLITNESSNIMDYEGDWATFSPGIEGILLSSYFQVLELQTGEGWEKSCLLRPEGLPESKRIDLETQSVRNA